MSTWLFLLVNHTCSVDLNLPWIHPNSPDIAAAACILSLVPSQQAQQEIMSLKKRVLKDRGSSGQVFARLESRRQKLREVRELFRRVQGAS